MIVANPNNSQCEQCRRPIFLDTSAELDISIWLHWDPAVDLYDPHDTKPRIYIKTEWRK